MKDIKEFLLEVLSDCAVSSADSEYIVRLIAAYTEGQEPVKGIDYDEAIDRYYIPVHPNWEVQTKGKGSTFRIARIDTGEKHLVLDKHLHRMLEDMARDINARFTAPPEPKGEVVITTTEEGRCVAVTRQDDEGRILKVLWEAPTEPAPQQQKPQTTIGDSASPAQPVAACAAPSSEEVTKMVARLYGDLDGGPSSWLKQEAAAFIERLAARVPDGCVVVPREATDEMLLAAESVKQYELSTPRLRWEAMIAAGAVKP